MENQFQTNEPFPESRVLVKSKINNKQILLWVLSFVVGLVAVYYFILSAPNNFPEGSIVNIEPGSSLRSVSFKLERAGVIRSRTAFEAFAIMYGGEKHLIPADYFFESSYPVFEIARRVAKGERNLAPLKVTIPEGYSLVEMANAFSFKLSAFSKENFLAQAKFKEGYLFPDTYFFFTTDTEKEVIRSMTENFEKKIKTVRPDILATGKSEKDIIIMASIIEKEAKGDEDRAYISGILWNRLKINMALQVDAAPITYKTKGLPEAPIASPGLESINAAIHPKASKYLYYLHDKEGVIHYAVSFEEHKKNISKYLR
jgi:UPF0755 protein